MPETEQRKIDHTEARGHPLEDSPQALRVWTEWLGREWEHVNAYYRLGLSRPLILLQRFKSRMGSWDGVTRTLSIDIDLIRRYPWPIVVDILKHEMAHQYVCESAPGQPSHGPYFKAVCERMGLPEWAAAASGELPEQVPDWHRHALSEEEQRLLAKTNKLLALARSDNEHEARLAMQRVQELYAKYHLDQIEQRQQSQFVSWVLSFRSKRIEAWQRLMLAILNRHFFVRTISFSQFDPADLVEYKAAEILGKRENVLMAEYVYRFLERTIHALWEKHRGQTPSLQGLAWGRARKEKRHFLIGVLHGFMELLDQVGSHQNLNKSEKQCQALVQIADAELAAFCRRKYPRTRSRRGGVIDPDLATYQSGLSEGQRIRLHKPVGDREGFRGKLLPP